MKKSRSRVAVEPFCGGATVGLSLLSNGLADYLVLAEKDERVHSFWNRVLTDPAFADKIRDFECTDENVEDVAAHPNDDLAFWVLIKNRCAFGGMLDAGLLRKGLKDRAGAYMGVRSKWNPIELERRVRSVYEMRNRIELLTDAFDALEKYPEAFAFIDPPYTASSKSAGHGLYRESELNHDRLFDILAARSGHWVATYDDCPEVRALADGRFLSVESVPMRTTRAIQKYELVITP